MIIFNPCETGQRVCCSMTDSWMKKPQFQEKIAGIYFCSAGLESLRITSICVARPAIKVR
ncbi:hypothetical protein [Comamonas sp. B-9]|uniref:hypothetical protein n=1 Tax=Comamonas sp. B-9 TaxID=1055192 RepID=UPI00130E1C8F|nr:hypothetical protein [Comamonas sp. B-9]